jgi:hypothetical protein
MVGFMRWTALCTIQNLKTILASDLSYLKAQCRRSGYE